MCGPNHRITIPSLEKSTVLIVEALSRTEAITNPVRHDHTLTRPSPGATADGPLPVAEASVRPSGLNRTQRIPTAAP